MHDLAVPGATYSEAFALNDNDAIVGVYSTDNQPSHAVLWKNGKIVDLAPQKLGTAAHDINSAGAIVGYVSHEYYGPRTFAVIWENGEMEDLNQKSIQSGDGHYNKRSYYLSSADSINNQGQILVKGCNFDRCDYFILTPND